MKVFVYTKKDSTKIATITDVTSVEHNGNEVIFISKDGVEFRFNTKIVKTTIYQN